nr:chemotaxis protein CheW [Alkalilimnicola ehrlichii]
MLPGSLVAEVTTYVEPTAAGVGFPDWVLGQIVWRGQQLFLVSFEALVGGRVSSTAARSRIAVVKGVSGAPGLAYYGLVTQQIPRLATVAEGTIENLDDDSSELGEAVSAQVLANGEPALIPNLDYLEQELSRLTGR